MVGHICVVLFCQFSFQYRRIGAILLKHFNPPKVEISRSAVSADVFRTKLHQCTASLQWATTVRITYWAELTTLLYTKLTAKKRLPNFKHTMSKCQNMFLLIAFVFAEMGEFDNSSIGSQDVDLEEELQPLQLNTQVFWQNRCRGHRQIHYLYFES